MNGHGLHGTVDDAEAAALLCELRASPVVHTSALYPRPSLPHVHTHDLRLPSPNEILAQADWHRTRSFSSSSERLTSEPPHPLPRPAFSPAPTTHAFLYPESSTPTTILPPPRFLLDADRPKRKRETEVEQPPARRPRRATDESDESEYFFTHHGSSKPLSPPPPPRQASPPRRGYLSMSALGVLEAPPAPPRPPSPSPRVWETVSRESLPSVGREYHSSGSGGGYVPREFAVPREVASSRDFAPSSSRERDYPPLSARDYPPSSSREYPPSSSREYPPSSSRDLAPTYPSSSSREYPPPPPRRPRITAPAPDNVYMFPQPAMSPYGSERVSTPTSTLVPVPVLKPRPSNRPTQIQTSPQLTQAQAQGHRSQPPTPGTFRAPSFSAAPRVRGTSNADYAPPRTRPEPIEIEDSPEPEAIPLPPPTPTREIMRSEMGVRMSREQVLSTRRDDHTRTVRDELPRTPRDEFPPRRDEFVRMPRQDGVLEPIRTARDESVYRLSRDDSVPRTPRDDVPRTPRDEILRTSRDELAPRAREEPVPRTARDDIPRAREDTIRLGRHDAIRSGRTDDLARPAMGARFTDPSVPQFRAPVPVPARAVLGLDPSSGALGLDVSGSRTSDASSSRAMESPSARTLDVSPPSARRETFTSILARHEMSGPIPAGGRSVISPVVGRRTSPGPVGRSAPSPVERRTVESPIGRRTAPSSAERRTAPSPVGRRTAPSPVERRTAPSPINRLDRPRTMPEPYTDTETDRDADAPSSPLSEDETAEEDEDERRVEVRHVAETSSHPFPFRPLATSSSSRPDAGYSTRADAHYSSKADARILHGDMEIYPANSPPVPKTVFGPAPPPPSGSGSVKRGRRMSTSPVVRTKKLPSPVVQTKTMTSPVAITRPLPMSSPIASKKAELSPVRLSSVDSLPPPPPEPASGPKIRCVCRSTQDDRGRTIVCEGCGFRQHARCYGMDADQQGEGRWMCGMCEAGPGGWRKDEKEAEGMEVEMEMDGKAGGDIGMEQDEPGDKGVVGMDMGEGEVERAEVEKDQVVAGKDLAIVGREEKAVDQVGAGMELIGGVGEELDTVVGRVDVEMEVAEPEKDKVPELEKEKDRGKGTDTEREEVAAAQPKKDFAGKAKAPGPGSKPGLGGFKTNAKNAKSGTAAPSKIIAPPTKSLTPTVRTVLAPPKSAKASGSKTGSSKSAPTLKPLSSSSSKPPSLSGKVKSIKTGSRASSMNGSPLVRTRPLSPEPTPSAPPSPRSGSSVAPAPDSIAKESEARTKSPEPVPKVIEKAPTPPPSNPSPVATRTALPPSSPPRPPTPPAPSPPKPSAPSADAGDDDIDAALWATEYDHISSNIVDASLRERLRNFGRERLAKRAEIVGEKPSVPPLTPFTSAEPVFLTSSQPTSLVRVKEIKPPPNQHSPTYGVLATSQIPKDALVLEYRCALSDAHAYMSNKAHQYALLGTGTKYVRLVPAPLDICLDARVMGNEGRFVRCGCWPNAVVRPFICVEGAADEDEDEEETRFGVFALRELQLGEEIVLGWEWSVEHVVHKLVRDPKLGPSPPDEDVLNDPDTKRLWDILDLLRSLSLTCACKPDSSTCALSFGRILVEDTDSGEHATDLGPLIGYKRYEHGFEPTMHAVSTKTRRGRKSAGKDRKARQAVARPVSPIPKVPSPPPPPPVVSVPEPEPEPKPKLEPQSEPEPKPEPVPIRSPPRDPTPPPPHEPTPPLPQPVTTPAKRAIGKLSIASSPLSELSDTGDDHADEISPDHAPKRHRGSATRVKHRRRIESPSPEEDTEMRQGPASEEQAKGGEAETRADTNGMVATEEPHVSEPTTNQVEEQDSGAAEASQEEIVVKVEVEEPRSEPPASEPRTDAVTSTVESAHEETEPASILDHTAPSDSGHDHDHDSDHPEAPRKVSFLDWARRRRATQAAETREHVPAMDETGTPGPDGPPASTEVESIPSNPPSLSPTTATLPASSTDPTGPQTSSPRTLPVALAPVPATQPFPPPSALPARPATPPTNPIISEPPAPGPDVIMADPPAPAINGKFSALHETTNTGAGAFPSPSVYSSPRQTSLPPAAQSSHVDAMDVDTIEAVATDAGEGQMRASPSPFADGPSYQPSTSHTPPNLSPPSHTQPSSSPGVLPALTKRLSHLGVEQPKVDQDGSEPDAGNLQAPTDPSSFPVRTTRTVGDGPEEGEITPAARAVAPSYTPSNGSPATTSVSLPSGPRDRQPPTQPRRFSADPPPSGSPSGSRPTPLPYSRPPPSGPSRGVNVSPRAPPSGPRAERRGYPGPSPPTGPRERDRERERERERDRDRDRDRDSRGRGRAFGTLPRGPSADRGWRGRGRGLPSRGGSWRP